MSAEATSATGFSLLAQDVGRELVKAQQRINELEAELEETHKQLDLADSTIEALKNELGWR